MEFQTPQENTIYRDIFMQNMPAGRKLNRFRIVSLAYLRLGLRICSSKHSTAHLHETTRQQTLCLANKQFAEAVLSSFILPVKFN